AGVHWNVRSSPPCAPHTVVADVPPTVVSANTPPSAGITVGASHLVVVPQNSTHVVPPTQTIWSSVVALLGQSASLAQACVIAPAAPGSPQYWESPQNAVPPQVPTFWQCASIVQPPGNGGGGGSSG